MFRDLLVACDCTEAVPTEYIYQIKGEHFRREKQASEAPQIVVDRATFGAALESNRADMPIEVTIWTRRLKASSDPVKVYLYREPVTGRFSTVGILRG